MEKQSGNEHDKELCGSLVPTNSCANGALLVPDFFDRASLLPTFGRLQKGERRVDKSLFLRYNDNRK